MAPILHKMSPALQSQSLEVMLNHPNPAYLQEVRSLTKTSLPAEVLALAFTLYLADRIRTRC